MRHSDGLRASLANVVAPADPTDADFKQTTLLLHGDGTNGAQNNTFIDGSSNNFTITRNGNTTQGTFTPFSAEAGKWSNYFDGTGDFLSAPANTAFAIGTDDFTLEAWIYIAGNSAVNGASRRDAQIFSTIGNGSASVAGLSFFVVGSSTTTGTALLVANRINSTTAYTIQANATIAQNQWNHVAAVRSGTTTTLYLNGTSIGSGTFTSQSIANSRPMEIGGQNLNSFNNYLIGYISNARVVKGTAVYTSNFTPPTSPLTAITNTSLLTCQDNRFRDGSSNNFTITRNGDVRVTPFGPFAPSAAYSTSVNGGSGYFDGSGDYLSVVHNSVFNYGTSDFTIEFWVYPIAPGQSGFTVLYAKPNSGGYSGIAIIQNASSYNVGVYASTSGTSWNLINNASCGTLIPFSWNHIAVTRSGSNVYAFLNGTLRSTTNVSTSSLVSTTDPVLFGSSRGNASTFYTGYMSNSRIVTGTALYTADFTPPTALLTAITNTSLLLNFTNAGIIDSTGKNVLETVGNAQIDTTTKKYGTGSLEFDGSTDGLTLLTNPFLWFGTSSWTIEGWFYRVGNNKIQTILRGDNGSTTGVGLDVDFDASNNIQIRLNGGATSVLSIPLSTHGVQTGSWYHIAFVRNNNVWTVYVDGVSKGSATNTVTIANPTFYRIGANSFSTAFSFDGFIDDFRITTGIARYTSNFTPPTAAFADK